MATPDKIYLQACGSCDLKETCENCEFSKLLDTGEVTWSEDKIYEADVEYIRKGFLLDWAKNQLELAKKCEYETNDRVFSGTRATFEQIIDKLESL